MKTHYQNQKGITNRASMDKYKMGNYLGDGAFGSVVKAINTNTGQVVAIKSMKKKYSTWD